MKLRHLIESPPIGEFQPHGRSLDEPGSFNAVDRKAMQNPKWRAKLERMFQKTPFVFNIYPFNNAEDFRRSYETSLGTVTDTFDVSRANSYGSLYTAQEVEQRFGIVPKDASTSITVIFMHNEGDNKYPFTPWIVAHRVVHALLVDNERTKRSTALYIELHGLFWLFENFQNFMVDAIEQKDRVTRKPATFDQRKKRFAQMVSVSKATRDANVSNEGEILVDMMTHYLVHGQLTLGRPKVNYDQANFDKGLESFEVEFNKQFKRVFETCVGKIFVL